jgi:Late embryogenesis abundant protein
MIRRLPLLLLTASLAGCAGLTGRDPVKVTLAGVESLPGQGMELRLAVKLRLQNPNDTAIDFDGAALSLEVRGMDFASGVTDAKGSLPRYGEMVLTVPVTVSGFAMARQALSLASGSGAPIGKVDFVARGKLGGGPFGASRFESRGEFEMPGAKAAATP